MMAESRMMWRRLGLVFRPCQGSSWMKTHAQVPTPLLCDGFIRVYFASRSERSLSQTSFVDVDAEDPTRVLQVHPEPIIELGKPGTFDEHGIMPSCALRHDGAVLLYYSGWQRGSSVPYTNSTGLAVSEDGGTTFRKVSEGPVLGKGLADPYSATSPCVVLDDAGWHMWYCSGTNWIKVKDKYEHTYDIKYAESSDGIRWLASGEVAIPQRSEEEALTRPWVLPQRRGYGMWFCYRGSHAFRDGEDAYQIGWAHSTEGHTWRRCDAGPGMERSSTGWDSRCMAYPGLVEVGTRKVMFYNGNDFGAEGFGVAWTSSEGATQDAA